MIQMLQEVTDWGCERVVNGIYHVNDSGQLVAYQAPGGSVQRFKAPMKQYSKARRKFVKVGEYEIESN
tara:strand:+ start:322 stop:525 length:204 start_codon:yes stop_codon:yes gene_type:complete